MKSSEGRKKNSDCIVCGVRLDHTNTTWYRQKNYIHKCNECIREEKRLWIAEARKRDPGGCAERSRRSKNKIKRESPKRYTAQQMQGSSKKRANALGVEHNLSSAFIKTICPDKCPVFGKKLKYGGGTKTKWSPSLDRIIPERGYTEGNVRVVSLLANLMKNEATPDELRQFATWVLSQ